MDFCVNFLLDVTEGREKGVKINITTPVKLPTWTVHQNRPSRSIPARGKAQESNARVPVPRPGTTPPTAPHSEVYLSMWSEPGPAGRPSASPVLGQSMACSMTVARPSAPPHLLRPKPPTHCSGRELPGFLFPQKSSPPLLLSFAHATCFFTRCVARTPPARPSNRARRRAGARLA